MAIPVQYRLSGGAVNNDPNASLGGAESTTEIISANNNNLFAAVSQQNAINGLIVYRCLFIHAPTPGASYTNVGVWIQTQSLSTDSAIFLAVAPEGKNLAVETIADETTEPANVIFTRPTQDYALLPLPDLTSGDYIGLWIKRVIDPAAAGYPNDYVRLAVEGTVV